MGLSLKTQSHLQQWSRFLYERRDICREMGAHARETMRKNFSEEHLRSQLQDILASRQRLKPARALNQPGGAEVGAPSKALPPPERIVWLRTDAIGDNILAAGMLEPLRRQHPKAQLCVVCQEHVAELYECCPYVDEIVAFNRAKLVRSEPYRQQLLHSLNRNAPTWLLNSVFSRDPVADFFAVGIQAQEKVGHMGDLSQHQR